MKYSENLKTVLSENHPNCCLFKEDLDIDRIVDPSDYEDELIEQMYAIKLCKNLEFLILNISPNAKRAILYSCLYFGLFDGKERTIATCAKTVKRRRSIVNRGVLKIYSLLRRRSSKNYILNESSENMEIQKSYDSYADFLQACIDEEKDEDVRKRLLKIEADCIKYHQRQDISK